MRIVFMKTNPIYIFLLLSFTSLFAQNIALQKSITTSSVRGNNQGAFAVDGNQSTRWESDFSDPQFIIVDLATTYALNRVEIDWEAAYATQYKIELSNNKQQWTTVSNITSGNGGTDVMCFEWAKRTLRKNVWHPTYHYRKCAIRIQHF